MCGFYNKMGVEIWEDANNWYWRNEIIHDKLKLPKGVNRERMGWAKSLNWRAQRETHGVPVHEAWSMQAMVERQRMKCEGEFW